MSKATIYYHNIGDYLSREEKLDIISKFGSVANPQMTWETLTPNEHGDWLNQRNDVFSTFIPLEPEKKFDKSAMSYFIVNSRGNESSRDTWVYNSSIFKLKSNVQQTIVFYNMQVVGYKEAFINNPALKVEDFINTGSENISWSSSLISQIEKGNLVEFESDKVVIGLYRPFFKQQLYIGDKMIHRRGQFKEFFPSLKAKNLIICTTGIGSSKEFSVIISDVLIDIQAQMNGQCFPLYYYEENKKEQKTLFDSEESDSDYIRRDGVSDFILHQARKAFGNLVSKEDIFYYVYGFLHSPEYRTAFASDLKKMLPRIPLVDDVKDFWALSKAGRKLADLHLNYESVPTYPNVTVVETHGNASNNYKVDKMRFPSKDDKSRIIYNSQITIENIPAEAYEYIVNGKSAIEWIMERYQVNVNKDSGIKNDPNDWATEVGNPRYILDLLLSIIRVSVETVEIVKGLPKLKFE